MARRYNAGLVKRHRSYSIPEAAALLGVHKHTISRWIDDGLPVIDRKRPLLIHGTDLRAFIKARQPKKQPCRPGEMFCVRCSAPKRPAYDVADFIPTKAGRGLLRGLCPDCGGLIHRFVTEAKIGAVGGDLSVARPTAQSRMCDSPAPSQMLPSKRTGHDFEKNTCERTRQARISPISRRREGAGRAFARRRGQGH